MIRVAVDAMGGDNAPRAEIEGALLALTTLPGDFCVQLVGRPEIIEAELAKHTAVDRRRVETRPAAEVIGMAEKPLAAVRKKPNSSIVVGLRLQADGESDAFVSAGNTGAILAASTLHLGLHDGVERATVGSLFPTADQPVLVLDAGANVDCSSRELVGFAYLGSTYMRVMGGRPNPAVGLLNVGEEEEKGNAAAKQAHQLLKQSSGLTYRGNIEGRDILSGHEKYGIIDVVVCDGFVGNVVLKFYESLARLLLRLVQREAPEVLEREDMRGFFHFFDYSQYGGAMMLGVRGVSVICHGASPANSIRHAIRLAVRAVESGLSRHIGAEFAQRDTAAEA